MTLSPSLRMSSWPGLSVSALIEGWRYTFTLRPCERMVTVLSSLAAKYTPYVDGGAHSLSTSSFSAVICSRASSSALTSFSFWSKACASCRFASGSSLSRARESFGVSSTLFGPAISSMLRSNFDLMADHLRGSRPSPARPLWDARHSMLVRRYKLQMASGASHVPRISSAPVDRDALATRQRGVKRVESSLDRVNVTKKPSPGLVSSPWARCRRGATTTTYDFNHLSCIE